MNLTMRPIFSIIFCYFLTTFEKKTQIFLFIYQISIFVIRFWPEASQIQNFLRHIMENFYHPHSVPFWGAKGTKTRSECKRNFAESAFRSFFCPGKFVKFEPFFAYTSGFRLVFFSGVGGGGSCGNFAKNSPLNGSNYFWDLPVCVVFPVPRRGFVPSIFSNFEELIDFSRWKLRK